MTKTHKYDNLTDDLPKIAARTKNVSPFRTEAEFEGWLETQLDELEKLYSEFETKDSLRGFFKR